MKETEQREFWYRLDSQNAEAIRKIGETLSIHNLIIEDMLNGAHLPKVEIHDDLIFIIARCFPDENHPGNAPLVYLVLGPEFVISVEPGLSFFTPPRQPATPEALFLALLDQTVDTYIPVASHFRHEVEKLEEEVLDRPYRSLPARIQTVYKQSSHCRRGITILHDEFLRLRPGTAPLIHSRSYHILYDIQDHLKNAVQILDGAEALLLSVRTLYQDAISQEWNISMNRLTLIMSIFIPPTFIAGVYGMNFVNMPELHTTYGYFVVLSIMILIGVVMWLLFRRSRWL